MKHPDAPLLRGGRQAEFGSGGTFALPVSAEPGGSAVVIPWPTRKYRAA